MTHHPSQELENKVMAEIKSGRVKLRSKFIFLAEKLGLGSALILSVLLAVLFLALIFFYLKASDNLRYLSFGSRGLFAFLESFPYFSVIVFIILILLAGFILKKSGFAYQKPFSRLALALVGLIILLGAALTWLDVGERIERRTYGRQPLGNFFRPFLQPGFPARNNGLAGRVVKIEDKNILIQTPQGEVKISLAQLEKSLEAELEINDFILVIGERQADVFEAHFLRVITGDEPPMMQRGIEQRFKPAENKDFPRGNFEPCPGCWPPPPNSSTPVQEMPIK